uniref:Charged multivesicular body protein 4Bb n=1 Tax=Acanthochromis polyacanthus TaxID=80966 RepID=A0A3Q1GHR0_9TELE
MSTLLNKLFGGGGKGGKGPSPQEAIQKLRETEEMLTKKQEFLEKKIEQELQIAKKNGTKNKRAALQALKRKKRYEKQLAQIDGTLSTIEFQREALENANTNTEVLKNMGFAAKAMKSAHENMDIDKVDDLMQDITEQQELAQEISDAISKPVGFGEEFDEVSGASAHVEVLLSADGGSSCLWIRPLKLLIFSLRTFTKKVNFRCPHFLHFWEIFEHFWWKQEMLKMFLKNIQIKINQNPVNFAGFWLIFM